MANVALIAVILVVVVFITIAAVIRRYRRCPSDKILVVYGKTGGGSARCIHGGGKFIWPIIQDYAYLNLTPISIDANLTNALSRLSTFAPINSTYALIFVAIPAIIWPSFAIREISAFATSPDTPARFNITDFTYVFGAQTSATKPDANKPCA